MIYISATISFVFFAVGILFGWAANEVKHDQLYAKEIEEQNNMHPEMYDGDGNLVDDDLFYLRYSEEDDTITDKDD